MVAYGTWGHLCHSPNIADCPLTQRPDIYVASGARPVRVNRFGNNIEAYAVGGDAQAVLWADVVYEKERIDKKTDAQGKDHYHAWGTNQWVRQRLTNSTLDVRPVTAGTMATAVAHIGQGNYASVMKMGPEPQLNTISADAKHYPPDIPYVRWRTDQPSTVNEVDPAYVDPITLAVQRIPDMARPWRGSISFSLWGVKPQISRLDPPIIALSAAETTVGETLVHYSIAPNEYAELLDPHDVQFELAKDGEVVLSATGSEGEIAGTFKIPRNLPLKKGTYTATLRILRAGADGGGLASDPMPVDARGVVVEFTSTSSVVVQEGGKATELKVLRLHNAHPVVSLDPAVPGSDLDVTVGGRVEDDVAPIDSVLINGKRVSVANSPIAPDLFDDIGPFRGYFSIRFIGVMESPPSDGDSVAYGVDGTLAAATAIDAVGGVGWAVCGPHPTRCRMDRLQRWALTNMESLPAESTRGANQFRIELRDPRLLAGGGVPLRLPVHLFTGTDGDPHTVWLDHVKDEYYKTRPLYLVDEGFKIPEALSPELKELIGETRIPARLGARIRVEYDGVASDEGISSGVVLVDDQGQTVKSVPAQQATPLVTLADVQPYRDPNWNPRLNFTAWKATATGTVQNPISALYPNALPRVMVNGVPASLTARGAGAYDFSVTGIPLLSATRVNARAEAANGAVGSDSRLVTLVHDGSTVTNAEVEQDQPNRPRAPALLKTFRAKVYGPKLDAATISAEIAGVYSMGRGIARASFSARPDTYGDQRWLHRDGRSSGRSPHVPLERLLRPNRGAVVRSKKADIACWSSKRRAIGGRGRRVRRRERELRPGRNDAQPYRRERHRDPDAA